jgi:hypothetical protein
VSNPSQVNDMTTLVPSLFSYRNPQLQVRCGGVERPSPGTSYKIFLLLPPIIFSYTSMDKMRWISQKSIGCLYVVQRECFEGRRGHTYVTCSVSKWIPSPGIGPWLLRRVPYQNEYLDQLCRSAERSVLRCAYSLSLPPAMLLSTYYHSRLASFTTGPQNHYVVERVLFKSPSLLHMFCFGNKHQTGI